MIRDKNKQLEELNNILLRQLAAQLDIDTAMLSKNGAGRPFFQEGRYSGLPGIFSQRVKKLLTLWLADKILKTIDEEEYKSRPCRWSP